MKKHNPADFTELFLRPLKWHPLMVSCYLHHFISASANLSQPNLAASIMAHDNPNGVLVSLSCGHERAVENSSGEGGEVLQISLSLNLLAITCKNREHNLSTWSNMCVTREWPKGRRSKASLVTLLKSELETMDPKFGPLSTCRRMIIHKVTTHLRDRRFTCRRPKAPRIVLKMKSSPELFVTSPYCIDFALRRLPDDHDKPFTFRWSANSNGFARSRFVFIRLRTISGRLRWAICRPRSPTLERNIPCQ